MKRIFLLMKYQTYLGIQRMDFEKPIRSHKNRISYRSRIAATSMCSAINCDGNIFRARRLAIKLHVHDNMENRESTKGWLKYIVRKNNGKFWKRIGLNYRVYA